MKTKFKDTEIGMIPEDWVESIAEDFCERVTDGTHDSPKKQKNGKYLITSRHLKNNSLDFDNAYFISERDFNEINKRSKVDQFDIIFSMIGTIGEIYLEKSPNVNYAIKNVGLFKFNENKKNALWFYYFIKSTIGKDYIETRKRGSTQQYLTLESLRNFPVAFPKNQREQTAIAKILSDLDSKIELLQKQNKTLEAIAQAIFKHWFVDFEFPNGEGKPYKSSGGEMVDSELGGIPKGWEVKVILEVADVVDCLHRKKPNQSELGKLLLQVYNIGPHGLLDLNKKFFVSDEDYNLWSKNIELKEGDCLLTNAGLTGAIAQVPFGFTAGIGRNITAVRAKLISPYYLVTYLFSKYGQEEIEKNIDHGTIFNSLNVKGIRKIKLLIPENSIMDKFNKIIKPLRKLMENNLYEEYTLSQIRDNLLPKLMSGKIRVPVEVE